MPYIEKGCKYEDFSSNALHVMEPSGQEREKKPNKTTFKTMGKICNGEQLFARKRIAPKAAVKRGRSGKDRADLPPLRNDKKKSLTTTLVKNFPAGEAIASSKWIPFQKSAF